MSIQELADLSLKKAVLIDFWAEWCGPCKTFGPILDKVAAKYNTGLHLEKVDVEANPDLAAQFRIQSIPTIVLLSEGKIAAVSQGAMSEIDLEKWLNEHLPDLQLDNQNSSWKEQLVQLPPIPSEERISHLENWLRVDPDDKELQLEYLRAACFSRFDDAVRFIPEFKRANENHWLIPYFSFLLEAMVSAEARDQDSDENWKKAIHLISTKELEMVGEKFTVLAAEGIIGTEEQLKQLAVAFFSSLGDTHPVSQKYRRLFNMYLT